MRLIRLIIVAAMLVSAVSAFGSPDDYEEEAKHRDIRKLMEVSGELRAMRQGMLGMIEQMRLVSTQLPEGYWEEFKDAIMTDELPTLLVPVYDRHFSHDDVLALIEFWEGPVGQMLFKKQPIIQADAMDIGRRWGVKTGEEIFAKLKSREEQDASDPGE